MVRGRLDERELACDRDIVRLRLPECIEDRAQGHSLIFRQQGELMMTDSSMPFAHRSGYRARRPLQQGFTLIEIMVVIAILGILAALIVPKIMSRPDQARRVAASQDIGTIMQALNLYRLDNGQYPTQGQGLQALIQKPSTDPVPNNWKDGGYVERLPNDPWGNAYQYLNPGVHGAIDVFSYGADGKPGGEGNDADIGSWQ
jgi:general secretion pathway protein G